MSLKLRILSFALLGASFAVAASATPITAGTYNLTNMSVSASGTPYSLTGTVTLNSNGLITDANIKLNDAAAGSPTFDVVTGAAGPAGYNPVADYAYIDTPAGATQSGQLYLSYLTTLDSSGNIDLCILSAKNCNSYQASNSQLNYQTAFGYNLVDLNSGTLDPRASSVTPEPSSLLLLGTGLTGVAAMSRRRWRRA